ncbi:CoA-transferase family III [Cytidiella melzeri]|nr:CoA-transferase family III [Cytidiella melzeri]
MNSQAARFLFKRKAHVNWKGIASLKPIVGARNLSIRADSSSASGDLPLAGVRVLELGQVIAGPFCGQLLGYVKRVIWESTDTAGGFPNRHYGAEIIKVEPPTTGDPLRVWRELDVDGVSPWWRSISRNKKSVTIDLRQEEGRQTSYRLVKRLALQSDVLLENFKPGTLEKWGLGPSDLHPSNPSLIFTRVSGYGQTGPWSSRPGYASVCEAESGFRYINGLPDPETGSLSGPPVRPNISLGDSVAGLHAAFGTVLALLSRNAKQAAGSAGGQTVDVSIYESMINLMEGIIPEYDRKGKIRGPSGSSVTGIVPTNAYPCLPSPSAPDEPSYIVIGANADSIYNRMMKALGREDLVGPNYAHNHHRVERQTEIEEAIRDWTKRRTPEQVEEILRDVGVPCGRVFSVKEVVENPHTQARGLVEDVWVGSEEKGWNVKMAKVTPVLEGCDARTRWAGPELGQHNHEVLVKELGLSEEELHVLQEKGVVGQ